MNPADIATACVLAIDDSPEVLALLAVRLRPEGLRLVTAGSYDEGLALATQLLPDLILLDVDMPGHTGLDLCRRLKSDAATAGIPVIFLTASSDVDTKVHGFDLGAVDYVTKPFHPAELRARVRAALRTKRAQDMLSRRAQVDALTGLRNRAYLDERLAAEVAQSMRTGRPLSLVMMDLDHFKSLNDNFGHPFGDLVLQRIGDFLARALRPCDAACRYGGEELAIVLTDTTAAGAHAVAERIRDQVRRMDLSPHGKPIVVTASFGIAEAIDVAGSQRELRPGALLVAADDALYAAKHDGRDCVRLHAAQTAQPVVPGREPVAGLTETVVPRRDSALRLVPLADIAQAS